MLCQSLYSLCFNMYIQVTDICLDKEDVLLFVNSADPEQQYNIQSSLDSLKLWGLFLQARIYSRFD